MKIILKNKFVLLTVIVVLLGVVYIWCNNTIKQYKFSKSEEISTEEENKSNINTKSDEIDENENNEERLEEDEELNGTDVDDYEDIDNNIESEDKIYVYVTGEVNEPGVVSLNENSRIIDAINAAGGTTGKANISKVNLAYVLKDGMKINIPNTNDLRNNTDFEYVTIGSGDGKGDGESNLNNDFSNGNSSDSSDKVTSKYTRDSLVNINIATQTELETLPGIGPSTALKIINYRNENGKFSSIEDIKNVSRDWRS